MTATDPLTAAPAVDACTQARHHLERASAILQTLGNLGNLGELVHPDAALVYIATAHAEAATGHGWATLALTE